MLGTSGANQGSETPEDGLHPRLVQDQPNRHEQLLGTSAQDTLFSGKRGAMGKSPPRTVGLLADTSAPYAVQDSTFLSTSLGAAMLIHDQECPWWLLVLASIFRLYHDVTVFVRSCYW